jgi:hypothetical protein
MPVIPRKSRAMSPWCLKDHPAEKRKANVIGNAYSPPGQSLFDAWKTAS